MLDSILPEEMYSEIYHQADKDTKFMLRSLSKYFYNKFLLIPTLLKQYTARLVATLGGVEAVAALPEYGMDDANYKEISRRYSYGCIFSEKCTDPTPLYSLMRGTLKNPLIAFRTKINDDKVYEQDRINIVTHTELSDVKCDYLGRLLTHKEVGQLQDKLRHYCFVLEQQEDPTKKVSLR